MWVDSIVSCCQITALNGADASFLSLLEPLDQSRPHLIDAATKWHARLMSLAWSFFFPLGIIAARFYKITPRQDFPKELDNQTWWITHLICATVGAVAVLAAFSLVFFYRTGEISASGWHYYAGWTALVLLCVQIVGGLLRGTSGGPKRASYSGAMRGDHFDMTLRRIIFERVHKSTGYMALASAWLATIAGLHSVNAPLWIWLCVVTWWLFLVIVAIGLQMRRGAIDTYQAIWGTDPTLKGNKMTSIGIGVHRIKHPSEH